VLLYDIFGVAPASRNDANGTNAADAAALVAHLLDRGTHFDRIKAKQHAEHLRSGTGPNTTDDGGETSAYSHASYLLKLAEGTLFPSSATTTPTAPARLAAPDAPSLRAASALAVKKPATARRLCELTVDHWLALPPNAQMSLGSEIKDACILAAIGASASAPCCRSEDDGGVGSGGVEIDDSDVEIEELRPTHVARTRHEPVVAGARAELAIAVDDSDDDTARPAEHEQGRPRKQQRGEEKKGKVTTEGSTAPTGGGVVWF
jgi:hypothetical protein